MSCSALIGIGAYPRTGHLFHTDCNKPSIKKTSWDWWGNDKFRKPWYWSWRRATLSQNRTPAWPSIPVSYTCARSKCVWHLYTRSRYLALLLILLILLQHYCCCCTYVSEGWRIGTDSWVWSVKCAACWMPFGTKQPFTAVLLCEDNSKQHIDRCLVSAGAVMMKPHGARYPTVRT